MEDKTWIAKLLPNDEYREKRLLYFIAEAVFILGAFIVVYLLIGSFTAVINMSADTLGLLSIGFLIMYITLRYSFTGIEYPNITTHKRYKREIRSKIFYSINFWIIFVVIYTISKGIPSNLKETLDIVGPGTLAAIFLFILHYFSLKKSYKKNKELLDD
ncbi:hypothetical protein WMZ97_11480 [Lentibacillus sp. N15]|uniref:hypothetical protein n=1 Tax=Lentibacillus songyuanensis TaxID=3136161 RepID=UPI0031BADFFF